LSAVGDVRIVLDTSDFDAAIYHARIAVNELARTEVILGDACDRASARTAEAGDTLEDFDSRRYECGFCSRGQCGRCSDKRCSCCAGNPEG
jgi:hypothetical protein